VVVVVARGVVVSGDHSESRISSKLTAPSSLVEPITVHGSILKRPLVLHIVLAEETP
jgi:hypothetical protein